MEGCIVAWTKGHSYKPTNINVQYMCRFIRILLHVIMFAASLTAVIDQVDNFLLIF